MARTEAFTSSAHLRLGYQPVDVAEGGQPLVVAQIVADGLAKPAVLLDAALRQGRFAPGLQAFHGGQHALGNTEGFTDLRGRVLVEQGERFFSQCGRNRAAQVGRCCRQCCNSARTDSSVVVCMLPPVSWLEALDQRFRREITQTSRKHTFRPPTHQCCFRTD